MKYLEDLEKSFFILILIELVNGAHWDHSIDLNDDYRVLWNIRDHEIIFEAQVRTLGYIGLGFSRDGTIYGADVAIGWVDQGQAHFQVCLRFLFFISSIIIPH